MIWVRWMERRFNFDFPYELYPEILERLRGTPGRLEHLMKSIPAGIQAMSEESRWSILENAGHLGDAEQLWMIRVEDILAGKGRMREVNPDSGPTHKADHNHADPSWILMRFREARENLIKRLDELDHKEFTKSSIHPRLNISMRLVDLCLFMADHDDYHLAAIRRLSKIFRACG